MRPGDLQGGDLKTRTEATRRDEIGDLAKSFNTMADELEKEITGSEKREMELRKVSLVVEQSPNVVLITDTQGNIEYVNPKFTQLTGYTSEEVIGKNPRILKSDKTPPEVYKQLWGDDYLRQRVAGENFATRRRTANSTGSPHLFRPLKTLRVI